MEKNIDAVFYEFKYYILPDGYSNLKSISDGAVIKAKRLKEEECMAPNFVYESISEETLEITDSSHLFPLKVNLYTKKEYNEILLQRINSTCPGCLRYQDDGDDEHLDGHHREISLDGVCYEREDDENSISYATRVLWFYYALEEKLDELADCIEKKKADKFDKICKECALCILTPERFYGTKRDGKYYIYIQCSLGYDLYLTLLSYTAFASRHDENPLTKAGWTIIPFIPEGADGYKGKIKGNKLVGSLELSEIPWRYILKLKTEKENDKDFKKFCDDVYGYLSFKIGEDRVLRVIEGIDGEKSSATVLTADEICQKLREMDEHLPNSFPPHLPYGWENCENCTPYKKSVDGVSSCFTFANIGADFSLADNIDFYNEFAYAYIYVTAEGENSESVFETLRYYFENEQTVPEPVLLKEEFTFSFMITGYCECNNDGEHGWIIDFFVADEKMFYRYLRILAPVLMTYGAKLIVINSAGINEYVCGKDVLPVGGEAKN